MYLGDKEHALKTQERRREPCSCLYEGCVALQGFRAVMKTAKTSVTA